MSARRLRLAVALTAGFAAIGAIAASGATAHNGTTADTEAIAAIAAMVGRDGGGAQARTQSVAVAATILRDPFAGAPVDDDVPKSLDPRPEPGTVGVPDIDGSVAVPDIDGSASGGALAPVPIVRATIVGPAPVACIDDGSTTQIVRIGDVVAGRNVTAIDLQGITLADGSRLELPGAATRPHGSETDRRDARGHPRRPPSSQTPPATAVPPVPAAIPTASASATPRPLPTADARGLAPGANPTPDVTGPTAFPYPYPYAPPHR